MTAPRIVSTYEAEELRRISDAAIETMTAAGAGERETRAAVLVRDLAASVVALHARAELLDEAFTVITDGQVNVDWEGWCARVVRVSETIKVTP